MSELILDVRLDGFDQPIGALVRDVKGSLAFAYQPSFLRRADSHALSLSLPLTDEPYDEQFTRPFFDNLLQERNNDLAAILAREALERSDIAGILLHLGKDCTGALSILPQGAPPVKVPGNFDTDYEPLSDEKLAIIIEALHQRQRVPDETADPSPLAGVQSKIALTILPNGRFALPKDQSGAPTTHIIKVPDRGHLKDSLYEDAAMRLSAQLGFETASTYVEPIAGIDVLVITRFDRALNASGQITRIHQEDFAQALGLPASLKYERRGAGNRRFDAAAIRRVLDATAKPADARVAFIRATLFDLMIGNCDAHAKNHALLYYGSGSPVLAPRYDLLPTRLDRSLTEELPFQIGSAKTLAELTKSDFDTFMKMLAISGTAAQRRIRMNNTLAIANGLCGFLADLDSSHLKLLADLIAANIRQLAPEFDVPIPDAANGRDAFILSGGGWNYS